MNKVYLSSNYIIVELEGKVEPFPKSRSEYNESEDSFILRKFPNVQVVEFKFAEIATWFDFAGTTAYTIESLRVFLRQNTGFNTPTGGSVGGDEIDSVLNFSALQPGIVTDQLAFVRESQGTKWLPGTFGGTFYPKGWYRWDGANWIPVNDEIANQLALNEVALNQKAELNHTHTKSQITDFNDNDYATSTQGDKADTAIQPADLAFVAISGDYEDLANKPTNEVTSYRSEIESDNYIYSGFIKDNVNIIKRTFENIEEFASNVTDLEVDWSNRLTLNYS